MSIIGFLVLALICGVLLWGLGQLPIDPMISKIVRVVVIVLLAIAAILMVAGIFGFNTGVTLFPAG